MVFKQEGFPKKHGKAIYTEIKPVKGSQQKFKLKLPSEEFALKVLHDENANGRVDKKYVFVPAEGIGFSRSIKMKFGPPTFNEARIKAEKNIKIKVYYY